MECEKCKKELYERYGCHIINGKSYCKKCYNIYKPNKYYIEHVTPLFSEYEIITQDNNSSK